MYTSIVQSLYNEHFPIVPPNSNNFLKFGMLQCCVIIIMFGNMCSQNPLCDIVLVFDKLIIHTYNAYIITITYIQCRFILFTNICFSTAEYCFGICMIEKLKACKCLYRGAPSTSLMADNMINNECYSTVITG